LVFAFLGRTAYRWRWAILAVWGLALLAALPVLPRLPEALKVGGFSSPNTEAARAREVLQRELGFAPSTLLVIYQSNELDARDPAFAAAVERSLARVRGFPGVTDVILPVADANLISDDGTTAYAIVGLTQSPEEAQRLVPAFEAALQPQDGLHISVAGAPAFYRDIETVSQRDLRRAEVLVFPIALAALLMVFGSAIAALMPLAVGAAGVALVLSSIFLATRVTDLSIFVLNLATMLGLGLAVDYSLFVTSRFREELNSSGGDVPGSVERTMATAGRAVFFSGATVLIGLMGLSLFDFMFLRSVGIAGVLVVAWSTAAALTLLPALLAIVGANVDRFAIRRRVRAASRGAGFWVRLSQAVMARPFSVLIPTLAFLLLLGAPFLRANISSPDATILPKDLPSRQAFDLLVAQYGAGEISPFFIVLESDGDLLTPERLSAVYDVGARLAADPRITRLQSIVPPTLPKDQSVGVALLQWGLDQFGVETGVGRLANENAAVIIAYTPFLPNSEEAKALLMELRGLQPPGLNVAIDGGTAEIVDVVAEMYAEFPRAIALVVGATYLILLVLFRSVLLPLKAILMNGLSIVASYGALVWVFQEGNLSELLGFRGLGFVEASLPVIMFCVLFGLSMDYEVFLLSRIREEWERTGNNTRAVAVGLQRSGRIITSAAFLVVVAGAFVTAEVVIIKALGFGIALAVFLDATVVRALLVPSTMRLLGRWNWWMPGPLHRLLPAPLVEESA
jgi:RND superfamily putative drug exporter